MPLVGPLLRNYIYVDRGIPSGLGRKIVGGDPHLLHRIGIWAKICEASVRNVIRGGGIYTEVVRHAALPVGVNCHPVFSREDVPGGLRIRLTASGWQPGDSRR